MKGIILYWTMTGNTLDLAEKISIDTGFEVKCVSDIKVNEVLGYDTYVLGCPAMGEEELEENEFKPFYEELKTKLTNERIFLFGSYGWGDGLWMKNWEMDLKDKQFNLIQPGLIVMGGRNDIEDEVYLEFINSIKTLK